MNASPGPLSRDTGRTRSETPKPEIGPALKRDRLLQRVQAARKRLAPNPKAVARPG
jgi:hypothetical protein